MAIEEHEHGYGNGNGNDGLDTRNGNNSSPDYNEKADSDLEVAPSTSQASTGKGDPFGDETNSEVKYRTMTWWSVPRSKLHTYHSAHSIFSGKQG